LQSTSWRDLPADSSLSLNFIQTRKSQGGHLTRPAREELHINLATAVSVTDHGAIRPWRFVVIGDCGMKLFGEAIAAARFSADPAASLQFRERVKDKDHASMMIAIISSPDRRHLVGLGTGDLSRLCRLRHAPCRWSSRLWVRLEERDAPRPRIAYFLSDD
jgi:hypothetical protein